MLAQRRYRYVLFQNIDYLHIQKLSLSAAVVLVNSAICVGAYMCVLACMGIWLEEPVHTAVSN